MNMKKYGILALALVGIFTASIFTGCSSEKIAAKIGSEKIMSKDVEAYFNEMKPVLEGKKGPSIWQENVDGKPMEKYAKEQLLDLMIDAKICEMKAKELGITPTEEELKKMLEEQKQAKGGEEELKKYLAERKMTMELYTKDIKRRVTQDKLRDKLAEKLEITDDELKAYFKEKEEDYDLAKASHIVVKTEEEAKKVKKLLDKGEKFEKVAEKYSIDEKTKTKGGDLGFINRNNAVEAFSEALFALKPGKISDPVKTDVGYHIIKCFEFKKQTFEEAKSALYERRLNYKKADTYFKAMKQYKKELELEKHLENL